MFERDQIVGIYGVGVWNVSVTRPIRCHGRQLLIPMSLDLFHLCKITVGFQSSPRLRLLVKLKHEVMNVCPPWFAGHPRANI